MSDKPGPLVTLGNKLLLSGIPSLSILIAQVGELESYAAFLKLVETFLPERSQEILHETTPNAQIARFSSFFENRYFPLDHYFSIGEVGSYEELACQIPIVPMGVSYDDYHEMISDGRPGILLMTYLVINPYEDDGTPSVALAEACAEHVPQDLISRAAGIDLEPAEAHRLLDGTKYEAVALWADRVYTCANNFFLDTDYETLMGGMPVEWSVEGVETLTREWQQAEAADNKVWDLVTWLEADLPSRFKELVNFILKKREDEQRIT